MLTYGNQVTRDLRLMAFVGQMTTNNVLPPDTQTVRAPTLGFGASYRFATGTTITGTFLANTISDEYTSPTLSALGSGQNQTATVQIDQLIPLSARTFVTGSLSASLSTASFDSPGFALSRSPRTERYIAGLELTHIANRNWILTAGLDYTLASNTITITGDTDLTRAKLGATYLINDDTGLSASWTTGIGAEQTRRIVTLGLTHRF